MRMIRLFVFCLATTSFANVESVKLSEALGHMIGKNLKSLNVPLDMESIVKGLQDEAAGIDSPMAEDTCVQKLTQLQEAKNLKDAVAFLDTNKKRDHVIVLAGGKLQYEILKKGEGQRVQSYNSPLVRLKKEMDPFESASTDVILALDETIPGLKFGIIGMKEGEIRKLYIHPDLAFDQQIHTDRKNSLLIFEVEVITADASSEAHAASNADFLPIFRNLDDVRPLRR